MNFWFNENYSEFLTVVRRAKVGELCASRSETEKISGSALIAAD
jgi:hypothetical protein